MGLCKKIITGALIIGSLAGCRNTSDSNSNLPHKEEVTGIPLSVQIIGGAYTQGFSTVIEIKEGTYLLCTLPKEHGIGLTEAAALIKSEMNDGDNEPIILTGYRNADRFNILSISANGYTINLEK